MTDKETKTDRGRETQREIYGLKITLLHKLFCDIFPITDSLLVNFSGFEGGTAVTKLILINLNVSRLMH